MSSKTQDPVERAEKRVGTLLCNKWRLDALLGVGGMGAVYAATHRNQKRVAIKMLHAEASAVHDIRERFLREGYLANSVGHEGIVSVHDDDVAEDGSVFLVLELLEGETLEERATRKGGILSPSEVLSVADQLLDVLAAAHDRKLVHRDLKPDNLFLTNAGILKVLDFGIARLNEPDGTSSSSTRTGSLLGTPAFMAPEQARGRWKDVDAQSDLWSAGATLFALLTGRPPHEGGTSNEVLALAITQQAPSLASLRPDLPAPVTDLIDKSLSYDKQDRYPSARVMQEAVRGAYRTILGNAEPRPPALSIVDGGLPVEGVRFSNPSPASARTISERAAAFDHESLEPVPTKRPARIWIVGVTVLAALALAFGWRSWTAARSAGAEAPGDRSLEETSLRASTLRSTAGRWRKRHRRSAKTRGPPCRRMLGRRRQPSLPRSFLPRETRRLPRCRRVVRPKSRCGAQPPRNRLPAQLRRSRHPNRRRSKPRLSQKHLRLRKTSIRFPDAVDRKSRSLVRFPNGVDTDDADSDWAFSTVPTPGAENQLS